MFLGIEKSIRQMHTRGPDSANVLCYEGVVLGHCRLSIIDLDERASQPMLSQDGRYSIVFNGEIYNYLELRGQLLSDGVNLKTTSDTEVLLELFVRRRERMLPSLRGMFAFAIWDSVTQELFLARDAYGIKPLYYSQTGDGVVFCSQVKALMATALVPSGREIAGEVGFYLWGSVPEPWTMVRDVFALPAGHWLSVQAGRAGQPRQWDEICDAWRVPAAEVSHDVLRERVSIAVRDSIRAHLVADVPVCAFLSGGVDSAAVVSLAVEFNQDVEAITIAFDEYAGTPDDEAPYAVAIAEQLGIRHTIRRVSEMEFEDDFEKVLRAMDQPSIDGFNTWFASKAAAERGFRVALSGIGGDELFCGYPSFSRAKTASYVRRLISIRGAKAFAGLGTAAAGKVLRRPKIQAIPGMIASSEGEYFLNRGLFLPSELPAIVGVDAASAGIERLGGAMMGLRKTVARSDVAAVGQLESTVYLRNQLLRDSDWASMAHSLELRTPLVDTFLLRQLSVYVESFARHGGKRLLASAPSGGLPRSILQRRKTGFTLPMKQWMARSTKRDPSWARRLALLVGAEFETCV